MQQALPGQSTGASRTHLCMFQYFANVAAIRHYVFLLSCEGRGHVQHCQERVRLALVLGPGGAHCSSPLHS